MFVNLVALDSLLAAVAGLVNQHQLRVIEHLQEENRVLREVLGKRYLIIDRDGKYSDSFVHLLKGAGVERVRLPAKSPNLNARAERAVRTIKDECADRLIFFGQRSLYRAVVEFLESSNRGRDPTPDVVPGSMLDPECVPVPVEACGAQARGRSAQTDCGPHQECA